MGETKNNMLRGYKSGLVFRGVFSPGYFERLGDDAKSVREYFERSIGELGGVTTTAISIVILGYTLSEILK